MTTLSLNGVAVTLPDLVAAECSLLAPYVGQSLSLTSDTFTSEDLQLALSEVQHKDLVQLVRSWQVAEWLGHSQWCEVCQIALGMRLDSRAKVQQLTTEERQCLLSLPADMAKALQAQMHGLGVERHVFVSSTPPIFTSADGRWSLTRDLTVFQDGQNVGQLPESKTRSDGYLRRDDGVWFSYTTDRSVTTVEEITTDQLWSLPSTLCLTEGVTGCVSSDAVSSDGRYMIGSHPRYPDAMLIYEIAPWRPVHKLTELGYNADRVTKWISIRPDFQRIFTWQGSHFSITGLGGTPIFYSEKQEWSVRDGTDILGIEGVYWSENRCLVAVEYDRVHTDHRVAPSKWILIDMRTGTSRELFSDRKWDEESRALHLTDTHLYYEVARTPSRCEYEYARPPKEPIRAISLHNEQVTLAIGKGCPVLSVPGSVSTSCINRTTVMMPLFPGAADDMAGWLAFMSK